VPTAATEDVVFVPGDPPRTGQFAVLAPAGRSNASRREGTARAAAGDASRYDTTLDVVVPVGSAVRRLRRPARFVSIADALPILLATDVTTARPSLAAWATATRAGLGLIASGRLLPAATEQDYDAWRVAPLDPADAAYLTALAQAFPPEAHALPLDGQRPMRIASPEALIRNCWDALADTLVRTAAAPVAAGHDNFTTTAPTPVDGLAEWLTDAAAGTTDGAVRLALRIDLPTGRDDPARATVEVSSTVDPSLVVDAADLWSAPPAVQSRFGTQPDIDLLLGLRRGARAWAPLSRLLTAASPDALSLDDDEMLDLFGDAAADLAGAGIAVRWPAELVHDPLQLRATAATQTPGSVTEAGFTMESLLEFRWQLTLDGTALTDDEVAALAEAKRPLVRLRGRWIRADPAKLARVLDRRRRRTLTAVEALAAALTGAVNVDGEHVEFTPPPVIVDLTRRLIGAADPDPDPPAGLTATLRPYQRRGLGWLAAMTDSGLGGCLADDMGLGKTVQLIALHLHRQTTAPGPTLVVCPTSLLGNWERELARFAPGVPVRRYHGGTRHLDDVATDEVVLVTYGVVRRDRAALAATAWGLVVADEAQHVKNPLSRTARELRGIPAAARVALTGTPVENRLTDLWAILDWTTPGLLGPLDRFRREVAMPVERYRDPAASERLARLVRPFLLRRVKSDPTIAPELPAKTELDQVVPLTAEQTTLYEAVVRNTLADIASKTGIERRGLVFKLITSLKQICNHPAQFLHESGPLPARSGKLAALDELLDIILASDESVLVFTQYVELGRLLVAHLTNRGIGSLFLHGSTTAKARERMVADFQAGAAPVFVLSLKAGGVGLNLTRATHVIHYDRWWNPAVEDQATDRAYRIGQGRAVTVHRLVTEGTVEDKIAVLLAGKRDLAEAIVGAGEGWIADLSDADLADLVQLGNAG
jgi:superfamily II DNA or RNA helicase